MAKLTQSEVDTIRALKTLYKAKVLNIQQYKTLRGQVFAGDNDGAMRGLHKIINRKRKKDVKTV